MVNFFDLTFSTDVTDDFCLLLSFRKVSEVCEFINNELCYCELT